jgi:hypothetical protein
MAHHSYAEGEAASGIPVDQLLGHFGAHFGDEVAASAMHRDHYRTELPAGVRREYSSYCGNYNL